MKPKPQKPAKGGAGITGLNRPFAALEGVVRTAGLRVGQPQPPAAPPPQPEPHETAGEAEDSLPEEVLFLNAMDGVKRSRWTPMPVASADPRIPPPLDDSLDERRLMEAAVAGDPALELADHPEYIEGWIGVAGRRYLSSLRSGLYSIQGSLDLHGRTRGEARAAVEEFISGMSRRGSCCVKIVHGRGINSPSDRAVLKESLHGWLTTRRMSRNVVAYASAPFNDGGVGAVYVLIRKG